MRSLRTFALCILCLACGTALAYLGRDISEYTMLAAVVLGAWIGGKGWASLSSVLAAARKP